ncbi:hypothetical protein F2P79_019156 [Pimephales promelas]|nr:hypothetical protein F2P79_019156 [Pimephales promelas]
MRFFAQEDAIISGFIQSGTDTTPWITQRKTRAMTRARTSPPPGSASPLFESERDATDHGHVHGKDKVCTHCFSGAHVLDVAAQVPEILNGDERVRAVVLNVGANDIRLSDACGETTLPEDVIFEISTWNRFSPLRESERDDAVIIGTSMIRHIRATSGKDKVRTHCFPGAHVLDVAAQVPEILNGDERVGAVVLNVGANDIRLRF